MMEESINEVWQKTGPSPDQSRAAVESVIRLLAKRLPAPLAGVLQNLVGAVLLPQRPAPTPQLPQANPAGCWRSRGNAG